MKTKPVKRKSKEPVRHTIDGPALANAMRKALIPARFIRPEVMLTAFPWGNRMKQWLDSTFFECSDRGKSMYMTGSAEHSMAACAMLTRSLVMRGHDAVFTTLAELMATGETPVRRSEFLIIAGFWDGDFHKAKGCPMTTKESFTLSWNLWRLASEGTTLIVYCAPSVGGLSAWWMNGALDNMFERAETLTIK